jgi:hypothetical protein
MARNTLKKELDSQERVVRLTEQVNQLTRRLRALEGVPPDQPAASGPKSRRELLRLAGAGVVGAVGAAALQAVPAAAATGQAFTLGQANDANATTSLANTAASSPSPILQVTGPTTGVSSSVVSGAAIYGNSGFQAVYASGTAFGVNAISSIGLDLAANGTGRIYQYSIVDNLGNPMAGPPTFTPNQPSNLSPGGELVRDKDSVIWASRATDTGTAAWKRVNSVRVDAANGSGGFFTPTRIVETRASKGVKGGIPGPLAPNQTYTWPAAGSFLGTSGIPTDAVGIVGNLTVVASAGSSFGGAGYAAIFPAGFTYTPGTDPSTVNFGDPLFAVPNSFVLGFGTGLNAGKFSVYVYGSVSVYILVDVTGYLQ